MACGREFVGEIQARGSHVDRVELPVMPVGERRAATLAEGPAHLIGRAIVGRLTVDEGEPLRGEGKPRDRLRARRPAARDTVADRRPKRLPGHPVPHPPAKTSTLVRIAAHPFSLPYSVSATILAARLNLFAVPNLTGWNAYHGCDRGCVSGCYRPFTMASIATLRLRASTGITISRSSTCAPLLWFIRLLYWPWKSAGRGVR